MDDGENVDRGSGTDEIVALYDESGRPCGRALRSVVRRDNLRHAATAVVVRSSLGEIYVHRRTDTKDVYPGMYDFCAGGVVLDGEDPGDAAVREADEELGVQQVPLRPLLRASYEDEHTRYVAFVFDTVYDGPIRWQPSEVSWGRWMDLDDLVAIVDDPLWAFVPDSRAIVGDWLRTQLHSP